MKPSVLFFAAIALALVAAEARADVQADLENAEQAYGNLDYAGANKLADRALKAGGLTHAQYLRAMRVSALTHAGLDHAKPAHDQFMTLLICDPTFQMDPNLSPRVLTPFFEAKGDVRGLSVVPGVRVSVGALRAGEPVTMRVSTQDPTHLVKQVIIGYRWGTAGALTSQPIAVGDAETATIPAEAGSARFDYYAQALDEKRNVVFEDGNPSELKTALLEVTPIAAKDAGPHKSGFFGSTAFWVVTGVVVTGAAVAGGALLVTSKDRQNPTSISLGPSLYCGARTCN